MNTNTDLDYHIKEGIFTDLCNHAFRRGFETARNILSTGNFGPSVFCLAMIETTYKLIAGGSVSLKNLLDGKTAKEMSRQEMMDYGLFILLTFYVKIKSGDSISWAVAFEQACVVFENLEHKPFFMEGKIKSMFK